MKHRFPRVARFASVLAASLVVGAASAQTITFEKLPDGSPTLDQQFICDEYAVLGVRFELVDRTSGEPIGCPRIARFGPPENAFEGCFSSDTASGAFVCRGRRIAACP